MFTVVFIPWLSEQQFLMKLLVKPFVSLSMQALQRKFSLPEERQPALTGWRFAEEILTEGDQVLISVMEHHSNIIPWQEACRKTGAELVYVYLKDGALDMDDLRAKLTDKVKFVSLAHASNVLGVVNPKRNHAIGPPLELSWWWMALNLRPI